jgi:hypothetical protein
VGGLRKKLSALYSGGSDEAEGSGRGRGRGGGKGRGRGGGKGRGRGRARSPLPVAEASSSSEEEVPSVHAPGAEEEAEVEVEVEAEAEAEAEEQEAEEEAGGPALPAVWLRGPASLPTRPIPLDRRPLIRPTGARYVTLGVITTFSFDMLKITIYSNSYSYSLGSVVQELGEGRSR